MEELFENGMEFRQRQSVVDYTCSVLFGELEKTVSQQTNTLLRRKTFRGRHAEVIRVPIQKVVRRFDSSWKSFSVPVRCLRLLTGSSGFQNFGALAALF